MVASMKTISVAREMHEEAMDLLRAAQKYAEAAEAVEDRENHRDEVERFEELARDYAKRSLKLTRVGQSMFSKD